MATATNASKSNTPTFREPPARKGGKGRPSKHLPVLEALRKHPGKWAVLAENVTNTSIATAIKKGSMRGVEAFEFDATSRVAAEEGKFDIYVKFLSDDEREAARAKGNAEA